MSVLFTITSSLGSSFQVDTDEVNETEKARYDIEIGSERSASGNIKQQIRPGKRFVKDYEINVDMSDYINFINMITDQSDEYFINYTTAPELLTSDSSSSFTNDFKIAIAYDNTPPRIVSGDTGTRYIFDIGIRAVSLI